MKRGWILGGVIIIFSLLSAAIWTQGNDQQKDTRIYELPGTYEYLPHQSTERRSFAVSNPPEDLNKLKVLVEKYVARYLAENNYDSEDKAIITWCFFRETSEINEQWEEGGGYFKEDYIEWHQDEDSIAWVYCIDGTLVYELMQRSSDWLSYGDLRETRYWIEGSDYSSTEYWDIIHIIEQNDCARQRDD